MSEPTIASKLLGAVKSIFGRKDGAAPTTEEKDGTAPNAEETAAPATSTESTSPDTPAPAASEEETPAPEPSPAVVDSTEKAEIAAELANNETPTVSADSSVFEEAKAAASAASTTDTAAPAADELPVPNYDTLTIASVRARLRKLTLAQVRQLRAYETAGANRPDFVKMYDNRIAKLEAEGEA